MDDILSVGSLLGTIRETFIFERRMRFCLWSGGFDAENVNEHVERMNDQKTAKIIQIQNYNSKLPMGKSLEMKVMDIHI